MPFGVGSRLCIGCHFTATELTLLLSILAQRFDFVLCSERKPGIDMVVTLQPKDRLRLKMSQTESREETRGSIIVEWVRLQEHRSYAPTNGGDRSHREPAVESSVWSNYRRLQG
ncbi:cytochrome P450 [Methylomicrobium sp. RS1]|uniref:cytochrome P450 n=1 Tax=Candidatus Methylomicrobium oryzae TaxID=2802053 RepID=UPI001922199E|nr:cytochrome P450 [Methylomicrobium sp. RS1]